MQDHESFISELHDGNRLAFQQLFDTYYRLLCNYACRLVADESLSEDIVAVSFDKIWQRRKDFTEMKLLVSYLYRIVRNASLDEMAVLKKQKAAHRQFAYLSQGNEEIVYDKMIRRERLRSILDETETLPPKIREVFGLIYLEGLSLQNAAIKLGVSLNTVKTQHAAALRKLRESLRV